MKPLKEYRADGIIISTIEPTFLAWNGRYETAISFDDQQTWFIAEGYNRETEAVAGHERYAAMTTEELLNKTNWI